MNFPMYSIRIIYLEMAVKDVEGFDENQLQNIM